MRLVVDTNILISALLADASLPAHLVMMWRDGQFRIISSAEQLDEITRVTRYPKIKPYITPSSAGRLINELREIAVMVDDIPIVTVCGDPDDNYLLGMAAAGAANFLVTGDKRDLLALKGYGGARIVAVREFLTLSGRLL